MKKIAIALMIALGACVAVTAGVAPAVISFQEQVQDQQGDKEKIDPAQLPDPVKQTLGSEEFSGWAINAAYKLASTGNFEVELKKGSQSKVVKLDKDGNIIS